MAEFSSPLPVPVIAGVDTEDFAFPHQPSSPHSLKHSDPFSSPPAPPLQHHDYNFSTLVYDESSASASNTDHENEYTTEDEEPALVIAGVLDGDDSAVSNRTSISSFPGSIVPTRNREHEGVARSTPTRSPKLLHHHRSGSLGYTIHAKSPERIGGSAREYGTRDYSAAFRNPSSVRAMQMHDESSFLGDEDDVKASTTRRKGSRMSIFSHRSSGSTQTSPSKRKSSPLKNGSLKTEFPLVLLHCTLLPATLGSLSLQGHLKDENLLKEILPDEYWKRWKILKEKVQRNVEVRTRGVLIPHPRGEYELLEERLLESLELSRARIREGHYLRREDGNHTDRDAGVDTGAEAEQETVGDGTTMKTKCPDCGNKVSMEVEMERKWEVKVYAANGLMRAGAWSAAWGEMEKVDVEVGVWMPEPVRREVEDRLAELGVNAVDEDQHLVEEEETLSDEERRRREIYGDVADDAQEKIDGLYDDGMQHNQQPEGDHPAPTSLHALQPHQLSLPELVLRYFKILAQDKRNVLIVFLSAAVLFYAMNIPKVALTSAAIQAKLPLINTTNDQPTTSLDIWTETITSTSTQISVSTTTIVEPASSLGVDSYDHVETPLSDVVTETERETETLTSTVDTETSTASQEESETETAALEGETPSVAQILIDILVDDELME